MNSSRLSDRPKQAGSASEPAIEIRGLTTRFGTNVANNDVNLTINRGEIHALVGENGAGKTTLMNALAGLVLPDSGEVEVLGRPLKLGNPHESTSSGFNMVHQHFKLVPSLTAAENIYFGREPTRWGFINRKVLFKQAGELAARFGLQVDVRRRVQDLSVSDRQRVEILRVLSFNSEVIALDEPTAVLAPSEVRELFTVVRSLRETGRTVIVITHKLDEVAAIADRCTVMRAGHKLDTLDVATTPSVEISRLMVGRDLAPPPPPNPNLPGEPLLEFADVRVAHAAGTDAVKGVNLTVRRGEIVGVAGVEGNGQAELAELAIGTLHASGGRITVAGQDVTHANVKARRELGVAYVAEDRYDGGCSPEMSIADNLAITNYRNAELTRMGVFSSRRVNRWALSVVEDGDIRGAKDVTAPLGTLSGGNAQRVIIARELLQKPRVFVASQPCRGVDVGAMERIHAMLRAERDKGNAVLVISADLSELLTLSDRIVVMYNGRVAADLDAHETTREEVGQYMMGLSSDSKSEV